MSGRRKAGRFTVLAHDIDQTVFPVGTEFGFGSVPERNLPILRDMAEVVRDAGSPLLGPIGDAVACAMVGVTERQAKRTIARLDAIDPLGIMVNALDDDSVVAVVVGRQGSAEMGRIAGDEDAVELFRERRNASAGYHVLILTDDPRGGQRVFGLYEFILRDG